MVNQDDRTLFDNCFAHSINQMRVQSPPQYEGQLKEPWKTCVKLPVYQVDLYGMYQHLKWAVKYLVYGEDALSRQEKVIRVETQIVMGFTKK